eukprot:15453458-Alexandrium_andersonii.AAC.1
MACSEAVWTALVIARLWIAVSEVLLLALGYHPHALLCSGCYLIAPIVGSGCHVLPNCPAY